MDPYIIDAFDIGDDVLLVKANIPGLYQLGDSQLPTLDPDNWPTARVLEARGWVSAITNHYDTTDYDTTGYLVDGAKPRPMDQKESLAYCKALVVAQFAHLASDFSSVITPINLKITG